MLGYTIGRTMSETDGIPEEWVKRCNEMNETWVPTEFHREVFIRSGVQESKVVVIPEPVDTVHFNSNVEPIQYVIKYQQISNNYNKAYVI